MKIALLGDIAFFGKFSLEKNENLYKYFEDVSKLLNKYDMVIGNLETPFVTNQREYGFKSAYIKADPINIKLIQYLNIDIVNLANNHIYDYGKEGLQLTKKILDDNNVKHFGTDNKQLVIDFETNKIALHGYCCYSTNPLGIDNGVNELNFVNVKNSLIENNKNNLFNIIGFHCGQEHVNFPNLDHIEMGRKLSEISPYIFYGHHPHVAQGVEKVNNSLLAYSLGNFCFDDVYTKKSKTPLIKQSINNKESFILEIEIENNILINHKIIPIFIGDEKLEIDKNEILKKIETYSKELSLPKNKYLSNRLKLLTTYIERRKSLRNFNWYLKRINIKSAFIILNAKRNNKKYEKVLKKYL